MMIERPIPMFTAKCRTIREEAGFRLTFFCELCGSGYTTPLIVCDTPKEALHFGEQDARLHFNRCESCHHWVCDEHFNEDLIMCTACMPRICSQCGSPTTKNEPFCKVCNAPQHCSMYRKDG